MDQLLINLDTGNGITLETAFEPTKHGHRHGRLGSDHARRHARRSGDADRRTDDEHPERSRVRRSAEREGYLPPDSCGYRRRRRARMTFCNRRDCSAFDTHFAPFATIIVTQNMGMYRHTVAASALHETGGGNNLQPTSAIYQAAERRALPTMTSQRFEPPQFALGGLARDARLARPRGHLQHRSRTPGVRHARELSNGGGS